MRLNTVYTKALIERKQIKMGMADTQGKNKALDTNRDTEIAAAHFKAFMPLHLDLVFLITFLRRSAQVFIRSRENYKTAYLGLFKLGKSAASVSHALPQRPGYGSRGNLSCTLGCSAANEGSRKTGWKTPGILDRTAQCIAWMVGMVLLKGSNYSNVQSGLETALPRAPVFGVYNTFWESVGGQKGEVSGWEGNCFSAVKSARFEDSEKALPFLSYSQWMWPMYRKQLGSQ